MRAEILTWEDDKPKSNVHKIAREARYKLLTEYCHKHNIEALLLGHHLNDQAETVMMRIMRGTGVTGLAGMPKYGEHNGIKIIRPLLEYTRAEIEETMHASGWTWVEDPSNKQYTRGSVRSILSSYPEPELIVKRLNLLAENARRSSNYIDHCVEKFMHQNSSVIKYRKKRCLNLDLKKFCLQHEEIGLLALRYSLLYISKTQEYPPRLDRLKRLYTLILQCDSKLTKTLCGCIIHVHQEKNFIRIMAEDI